MSNKDIIPGVGYVFQGSWGHSDERTERHNRALINGGIRNRIPITKAQEELIDAWAKREWDSIQDKKEQASRRRKDLLYKVFWLSLCIAAIIIAIVIGATYN